MHKKILIIMIAVTLILTGCTKISDNLDDIVNATMSKENNHTNTVSTSYELYIPIGVTQVNDNEYNQKFKIKNRYVYLYVDTVSYYYKNALNYKSDSSYSYYYKELRLNDKVGYIGINKLEDDSYFCEIVYNYYKIEFYASKEELPFILTDALIIQNSIKYNDELIKVELESSNSDGREITYELDKPKDSESTFSKYLQEFVVEEDTKTELPDED